MSKTFLVLTSPSAIHVRGQVLPDVVEALAEVASFAEVGVLSNNTKPDWFDETFGGIDVEFLQITRRQGGGWLEEYATENNIPLHRVFVLAGNREDLQMAKNNGVLLVGAAWSGHEYVANVGLDASDPAFVVELARLVLEWDGQCWYRSICGRYRVFALCDASTRYTKAEQQRFGQALQRVVKSGTDDLRKVLALAACSLSELGISGANNQLWGLYPSSSSKNDDNETLSDFTRRLRTTASKARHSKAGEPLFVRHAPTPKRSATPGADREDPTGEVQSIHLNPVYRKSLKEKDVIVLDDFTTYGVSLAVAAGFLLRAGVKSVTGIALGKFGGCIGAYDVQVKSDPFRPVRSGEWTSTRIKWISADTSEKDQSALRGVLAL